MIIPQLNDIKTTVLDSSSKTLLNIISSWPNILAALGIILVGYLLMKIIIIIIIKTADKLKLHKLSEKSGLTHFLKKANISSPPSKVIANFLGGYIFTMMFLAASKILGLNDISLFLDQVIRYIPKLIVALFIVLFGTQIANTTKAITESTLNLLSKNSAKILAEFARAIIILFAIITALFQLNIAENLVRILFIGIISSLSLASGLALGLGSKDFIKNLLKDLNQK
jgi:hypothetical protein